MAFSMKGFAVLLLLTILASFSVSSPIATTTALAVRDCIPVDGEWECAPFVRATPTLDAKSTSTTIRERDDLAVDAVRACDNKNAPLSKDTIKSAFVEPFCRLIGDQQLRQSSIDTNPIVQNVQMYLYVGTQSADWIYALGEDLCINSFIHIINLCSGSGPTVGGSWFTEHMKYEIRVLQVGGPFDNTESSEATSPAILERDDTTLECDSMSAPFSKSGMRIDFIEPFCDRIDDMALRQSSVDENPISNSIQMYLYVGTQSSNWIYALEKDLCVNSFMHIIDKCTEFTATKGGKWFTDHLMYEIRVLKVGPPFT